MGSILLKGIVRNGRVEVTEPINLPDGSEVIITSPVNGESAETPTLPAWCNFYAGLSEKEIEEIERIAHDRSNFMRPITEDAE